MSFDLQPHPQAAQIAAVIEKSLPEQKQKQKRIRDAAAAMGLSEGLLIAARVGQDVTRLQSATKAMLKAFIALGEVMVLTRNESCVHEKVGEWGRVGGSDHVALVLNGAVDLRIFLSHWQHVFAIVEDSEKGVKRSIQIFDKSGDAVHKIHLRPQSNIEAFDALIAQFRHDQQISLFKTEEAEAVEQGLELSDDEVDVAALRDDWRAMTDVHQFFGMLKKHKVSRHQAHQLVGEEFAIQLDKAAVRSALTAAAESALPIMVFVSNKGCVQIHSGPIETLKTVGPWFNILDAGFNLHLREDHIHSVWLVRKPNVYGHVTAIEVYDAQQKLIVQFYGVRDERADENPDWRALAESLPHAEQLVEMIS